MNARSDQWLIRTKENLIAGPYTTEQVRKLVREGQLSNLDELCQANQYWFQLQERDELKKFLGIETPQKNKIDISEEEITETETATLTADVTPPPPSDDIPELPQLPPDDDQTRALPSHTYRKQRIESRRSGTTSVAKRISVSPQLPARLEGISWLRNITWLLIGLAALILYGVLKLIRS